MAPPALKWFLDGGEGEREQEWESNSDKVLIIGKSGWGEHGSIFAILATFL